MTSTNLRQRPELKAKAQVNILGGASLGSTSSANDSPEERRQRVLEATMNQLWKEEEEINHSCGTSRSTAR